jgi:hypothetical protein
MNNIRSEFDIDKDGNSEYFQSIAPYIYQTVDVFSLLRDYLVHRIDANIENSEYIKSVAPIVRYIGERCQAFTMLMQYGYLWDADIVMRCVMEASIRIGYLSYTEEAERKNRANEYWESLSEINRLRQSDRAKLAVQTLDEKNLNLGLGPIILSPKEEAQLRDKWSSQKRHDIEQKWSFTRIIASLEQHMVKTTGSSAIKSALWVYGLSSHLIHADETAIRVTQDRTERPKPEREKMIFAHAARLLSDEISYIIFVSSAVTYALGESHNELRALMNKTKPLFVQLNSLNDAFYDYIVGDGTFSEAT